jgi:non-heme chloroperoxidase
MQGMMAGPRTPTTASRAFSETDFIEDLKKIDVPTLIVHGDDDQIVPMIPRCYPRSWCRTRR